MQIRVWAESKQNSTFRIKNEKKLENSMAFGKLITVYLWYSVRFISIGTPDNIGASHIIAD